MTIERCNWCPDPLKPHEAHHPDGQTLHRHKIIVWAVPKLTNVRYDMVLHKTVEDAVEYINENLGRWLARKFPKEELEEHGFTLKIEPMEVTLEEWEAVFVHGEEI